MTPPAETAFADIEADNARLRAALSDANHGLNTMAMKLTICAGLLGFSADDSVEQIRAQVKMKLRVL